MKLYISFPEKAEIAISMLSMTGTAFLAAHSLKGSKTQTTAFDVKRVEDRMKAYEKFNVMLEQHQRYVDKDQKTAARG